MILRSPFFFFLLVDSLPLAAVCWSVVCWSLGWSSFTRWGAPGVCVSLEGGGWLASGVPVPAFALSMPRVRLPVPAGFAVAAGFCLLAFLQLRPMSTPLLSFTAHLLASP